MFGEEILENEDFLVSVSRFPGSSPSAIDNPGRQLPSMSLRLDFADDGLL